jgi:Rrf2 family protein
MFSKACEYGIKAAVFITVQSQQHHRVGLSEIAREIESPIAFTAKVLQKLSRNQLVDSVKGSTGGYEISVEKAKKISLSQIVTAIDGNAVYKGCGLGFHQCNDEKPCAVHHQFVSIRNDLQQMLETTTLLDLSKGINNEIAFLKR